MVLQLHHIVFVVIAVGMVSDLTEARDLLLQRVRRQSDDGNGEVIDNIFNIPITAIRQTAAAAQSFYPDSSSSIDSVFNIPVATLEAVGNLVKSGNPFSQRRPSEASAELQKRRKERRDRLLAHRKAQRLQHNDPLGVNALTDLLVGHHGLFGGHGGWGGHISSLSDHLTSNLGSHISSHFGGHGGSHGDGGSHDHSDTDDHDSVGEDALTSSSSSSGIFNNNGYEVTEDVDEDRKGWGGWFDFGNLFGGSSSGSRAQNKIAPRPDRRNGRYSEQDAPLENKVAPKNDRRNYRRDYDRPLENKIAPNNDRRNYQRHSDPNPRDRAAPKREGRDRFVFEHRSL